MIVFHAKAEVSNLTNGDTYSLEPITEYAQNILEAGGIKAMLKAQYGN